MQVSCLSLPAVWLLELVSLATPGLLASSCLSASVKLGSHWVNIRGFCVGDFYKKKKKNLSKKRTFG
jgi:hypothetical protein